MAYQHHENQCYLGEKRDKKKVYTSGILGIFESQVVGLFTFLFA